MVHLAQVKKNDSSSALQSLQLQDDTHHIEDASCVYGSRFALQQLPSTEMPEAEMPREVAYRMIKDDLSLDGNPMLKCVFRLPLFSWKAYVIEWMWCTDENIVWRVS